MIDTFERYGKVYTSTGYVAVLYSPGFGGGWYSWNEEFPECLFDPVIVERVLNGGNDGNPDSAIISYLQETYGEYFYPGGLDTLKICWMPPGTQFRITEYDGSEHIEFKEDQDFLVA